MPDPVPVIAYADARPGQPLGSLFTADERPDGVTLTKPLAAEPVRATLAIVVGSVMVLIVIAAVCGLLSDLGRPWWQYLVALLPLTAPACFAAAAFVYAAAVDKPRTLTIAVDAAGLAVTNGPVTLGGQPWRVRHPIRFRPGTDVLGPNCPLLVKAGRWLDRQVLPGVPKAECRWLAGVLNAAAARAVDAAPPGR